MLLCSPFRALEQRSKFYVFKPNVVHFYLGFYFKYISVEILKKVKFRFILEQKLIQFNKSVDREVNKIRES